MTISLGEEKISTTGLKLVTSYADSNSTVLNFGSDEYHLLILPKTSLYIVSTGKVFPRVGKTKICAHYTHNPSPSEQDDTHINIWQGQIKSNELEFMVQTKDDRTTEEKIRSIEKEAQRHIDLIVSPPKNPPQNYNGFKLHDYLLETAPDSVPFILANMKHPNERVRRKLLFILRNIIDKGKFDLKTHSVSLIDDIISDLENSKSLYRGGGISILISLYDAEPDNKVNREKIVQALIRIINNSDDQGLRSGATIGLIVTSKVDGYREVFKNNRIDSGSYRTNGVGEDKRFYTQRGYTEILHAIRMSTGLSNMTSIDDMKKWWEENKDRLEAEQAAADAKAAQDHNQENNNTKEAKIKDK